MKVGVRVQSGGYVRGDGHVIVGVGIRERIVATMEFGIVSFFTFNGK